MSRWLMFLTLGFAVGVHGGAVRSNGQEPPSRLLPGDQGPRVELVGRPPDDNEVVEVFVYEGPEQAAAGAARPRKFRSGVSRLRLDLRLKNVPWTGERVHYEVFTTGGRVEIGEGLVSIVRLQTLGVASMDFELVPQNGRFSNGPYQLRLSMNDAPIAVLNWSIGPSVADGIHDPLPRATPDAVGLAPSRLREATDLLNRFVAEHRIAGAVAAVARHGKLAYLEAVGLQDLERRTPMSERSLFRIYSMTKSVTSVAVMMLHEEGRFRLIDPVARYLPEFRDVTVLASDGTTRRPSREITIEDLLLHTSGLNHRTSEVYRRAQVRSRSIALPQFVANIVRVPLMEDPGTRYRYSEATTVLGRLVEIWSGKPLDVFLEERVFRPLRMTDTGFQVRPDQRGRLSTVYASAQSGGLTAIEIEALPFTERPALLEGAVGLVSTAPDYLRFAQMLLNKGELDGVRLLGAKTVETMTSNGLSDSILKTRGGGMGWGLANVNVVMDPAALDYPANRGEYGWDGSAGTIFWIDPAERLITVLMTQSAPANPGSLRQRFKALVQQSIVPR